MTENNIPNELGTINPAPFEEEYEDELKCMLIENLSLMPQKAQEIMLAAPNAFFDSLTVLFNDDEKYLRAEEIISKFRDLGTKPDKPMMFQYELTAFLASKKIFFYYDDRDNWRLFDMVTDYRFMIKNAHERRVGDHAQGYFGFGKRIDGYEPIENYSFNELCKDDVSLSESERFEQQEKFENVIGDTLTFEAISDDPDCNIMQDIQTIVDDLRFRLTMSPWEWHIWRLCAAYVYAYQDTEEIFRLFDKVMSEDYVPPENY